MRRITALIVSVVVLGALPSVAAASPLNFLTISPSTVNNGESATGLLSLSFLDPAPTTVLLFSSDPTAAQVPRSQRSQRRPASVVPRSPTPSSRQVLGMMAVSTRLRRTPQ